jgi:predicted RNA-binding Zn-ribbon protein involved in translation (DUF1610 family)
MKTIEMTEEEYQDLVDDYCGVCLSCEEIADNVEPDATNYKCDSCGKNTVFGIEEALIMGNIDIT